MSAIPTMRLGAGPRRWLAAACIALLMAAIATAFAWPVMVRHLVVSRLEGLTHRTVRVDAVQVNPFTGRVAVAGLQLFEGDDEVLFAAVERFDARVRPLSLLRVVRLTGTVASEEQKALAERVAKSVGGVRRVVNALEVRPAPS